MRDLPTCPRCPEPVVPGSFQERAHELRHELLDLRDAVFEEIGSPIVRWLARRIWKADA